MENLSVGIFYSILAGFILVFQGIFNTGLGNGIGQWEATTMIHFIGFVFALVLSFMVGDGSLKGLSTVNKLFISGGALGVIIVYSTMKGVSTLGASFSAALMVTTQLGVATVVDSMGLFGFDKIPISLNRVIGLVIMIVGVVIFQFGNKLF